MNDKPALHPDAPVGAALRAAAHDSIAEARAALVDSKISDAEAVHDFRKAMKRWRALLRLLAPFVGEEARLMRTAARDYARELAGPRDAQSALDALNAASEDRSSVISTLSPRSIATIRARLENIRDETEATTLTPERRSLNLEALTAADAVIDRWPLDDVTFDDVAQEVTIWYRRARRQIPDDWSSATPEELHELRQRVIDHRYQMELLEPLWPRLGRLWVEEAQRLRNRLGEYQDLTLLDRLTTPHQPLARWRSRLTPIIAARQNKRARTAARQSARLFAETPKAFRRRLHALWLADQVRKPRAVQTRS
jgi:CHAD domain-containing protein